MLNRQDVQPGGPDAADDATLRRQPGGAGGGTHTATGGGAEEDGGVAWQNVAQVSLPVGGKEGGGKPGGGGGGGGRVTFIIALLRLNARACSLRVCTCMWYSYRPMKLTCTRLFTVQHRVMGLFGEGLGSNTHTHTHARAHTRTHARTHACTHTHTRTELCSSGSLRIEVAFKLVAQKSELGWVQEGGSTHTQKGCVCCFRVDGSEKQIVSSLVVHRNRFYSGGWFRETDCIQAGGSEKQIVFRRVAHTNGLCSGVWLRETACVHAGGSEIRVVFRRVAQRNGLDSGGWLRKK